MEENESPAQRAARLRREKREKRIREDGHARLEKITSLSGRPASQQPQSIDQDSRQAEDDPDEVVLTTKDFGVGTAIDRRMPPSDPASPFGQGLKPFASQLSSSRSPSPAVQDQDPLTSLLEQMLGDAKFNTQSSDFANPFGLPSSAMSGSQNVSRSSQMWWKLSHVVPTICFGLYLIMSRDFSGSALSRLRTSNDNLDAMWGFITLQLVLQTASLFYGNTASPPTGLIGTMLGFVPDPFRSYILLALRYGRMYTTFSTDALTLVFMLGAAAWFKQR